jgi:hypothetical protein
VATTYLAPGVYVEEVDRGTKPIEGVGTAVAAFVGFTRRAKQPGKAIQITNWNQFIQEFTEVNEKGERESPFVEGAYLPHAVYGYFLNGGGRCYVISVAALGASDEPAQAILPTTGDFEIDSLSISATEPDPAGKEISVEIQHEPPPPPSEGEGEPPGESDTFVLIVNRGGSEAERFDRLTMGVGDRNVETVVNTESRLIRAEMLRKTGRLAERRPAEDTYDLQVGETTALVVTEPQFKGDVAEREGIEGLEALDDVTMICVPDLMMAYEHGHIDLKGVQVVQQAILDHCEKMKYRFAILDPPPNMSPQEVGDWKEKEANYESDRGRGALYYPWIRVGNPLGANGTTMLVPPSGHIAGIYARSDNQRGVHKAPANEVVRGAVGLQINVTHGEQEDLNPDGVNCIRSFPGRGIRVWGARTISSNPSWRYINVRRLFNFVEASIEAGTQWVVFEPNDQDLWARVRRDVSAFLRTVWRSGALFGATPEEAFYVKCDEELNPPEERDLGRLIIEVGLAPVKPAEFVIFRISQWAGPDAETR